MKDDRLVEMRAFQAVVEAGSFTVAAQRLNVSQSFVSHRISELERRLGLRVLHRSTRTQRLTDVGERFLASCKEILSAIDNAETQIRSDDVHGELRISAPRAFGLDQIAPVLPVFLAMHPKLTLHFSLSEVLVNLIDENVDVAVRMGQLQDSTLHSRKLCDLQRIVVASPAYLAAYGRPTTPEELIDHDCLMWDRLHDRLNQWPFSVDGKVARVAVRGKYRSSDGSTLFELCKAGTGIMRVAEHLALPAIREGKLVRILKDHQAKDASAIHAVYLSEHQLTPRVRVFVDYLVSVFRKPPWHRSF